MVERLYVLDCGGFSLRYSFLYQETAELFGRYIMCDNNEAAYSVIRVTPKSLEESRWLVDEGEVSKPFLEFQTLMLATGNALLAHGRALFHGAALFWKERAWIITAPSGTGKTTQLRLWMKLLRGDAKLINGDKPILECRSDGTVWVWSSPWRGKEKMGKAGIGAPLGGIILLEQGQYNNIDRMKPSDAVIPLFVEFISIPEDAVQIRGQANILEQMLNSVPVWKLVNTGDDASAALTIRTICNYLGVADERVECATGNQSRENLRRLSADCG